MIRRPALITGAALVLVVVAYFLWWPTLLHAVQGIHGPFGGGPAMHGLQ